MSKPHLISSMAAALLGLLALTATGVEAAQNPFALERAGSRLPLIAQNDSETSGAATGKPGEAMQCGAGMCGSSMGVSEKPAAAPEASSDKCAGSSSQSAKPAGASQCGGGK
jgi:hypothetical protein